jgi:hypothetical protein
VAVAQAPWDMLEILSRLERWGADRGWVGPDPYEGLNSRVGRMARSKRARQAVIQSYKRLPFDAPWPLRAPATPNSKALALGLSGYASPTGQSLSGADEFLVSLPAQIERLNLLDQGAAWGYHFDVQTRHLFYGRETPNAVATSFVVEALCETAEATGREAHLELALSARPYLLSLLKEAPGHGLYFAYISQGSELIHNANLLVSGALARLHTADPDAEAKTAVCAAVQTTLHKQREDGLWDYGEGPNLGWADNFHTAYILEGLACVDSTFGIGGNELERGLTAWQDMFFEADGWARFYPERRYPLEPHCSASAIDLLCGLERWRPKRGNLALAERIASTAIRELWLSERDCFAFRRTARGLNKRTFMRWTNAPMFRALARLCSASGTPIGTRGSREPQKNRATLAPARASDALGLDH